MKAKVLVVGGAGYIGGVCAAELARDGVEIVTYDDLSTGHRLAVTGKLVEGDVRDRERLTAVLREGRFDAVLHFAALIAVGESVREPLRYYSTNVGGAIALLDAMADADVRTLVFSSTAAVYGNPQYMPLDEDHPLSPVSPYGDTKATVERLLSACRDQGGFRIATLRYFNAAGATPDGLLGESHRHETHLIPLALQAALGLRPPMQLFGEDYDTRDGTCERDYVHVVDLAHAHRVALEALLGGHRGAAWNVGTGHGTTVREVMESIERVTGRAVPHTTGPRRDGDPPALIASSDRLRRELGWEPQFPGIDDIVRTAAAWARAPRY